MTTKSKYWRQSMLNSFFEGNSSTYVLITIDATTQTQTNSFVLGGGCKNLRVSQSSSINQSRTYVRTTSRWCRWSRRMMSTVLRVRNRTLPWPDPDPERLIVLHCSERAYGMNGRNIRWSAVPVSFDPTHGNAMRLAVLAIDYSIAIYVSIAE